MLGTWFWRNTSAAIVEVIDLREALRDPEVQRRAHVLILALGAGIFAAGTCLGIALRVVGL